MSAGEPFELPVEAVRPSQCYLDGEKLSRAARWFDFDDPEYDPVPVREVAGEWVLLDGHTRSVLAVLAGADALVVVENDEDLPMELYRLCASWCRDDGITTVEELVGRVCEPDTFEERWVQRCHRAAERLGAESDAE